LSIIIVSLIIVAGLWTMSQAGDFSKEARGTSAAQFLKLGVGRAEGMGGAFTGLADDVTAIYWNPAGLAKLESPEVYASHQSFLNEVSHEYIAYAHPLKPGNSWGVLGISAQILSQTDIPKVDNTGTQVGEFSPRSGAASISYARNLWNSLNLGVTGRYINESIDGDAANAIAGDVGALYRWRSLSFGVSVSQIGGKMKFLKEEEDLPLTVRTGMGLNLFKESLTLAVDGNFPRDNNPSVHTGLEVTLNHQDPFHPGAHSDLAWHLRSGYRTDRRENLVDASGAGFTFGLGVSYKSGGIDFAYSPLGALGDSLQVGLHYRF